eukprot:2330843-Amphidinium_carterae.1
MWAGQVKTALGIRTELSRPYCDTRSEELPRMVFISRKGSDKRYLSNEWQVYGAFRERFAVTVVGEDPRDWQFEHGLSKAIVPVTKFVALLARAHVLAG